MVDPFVLSRLSNGLTIGGAVYFVAWESAQNVAVIVVQAVFDGDPLEELFITNLVDGDGKQLTFETELLAHGFLLELLEENKDVDLHTD